MTYISKIRTQIPDWALTPFFESENNIFVKAQETRKALEELEIKLVPFKNIKNMAFLHDYDFENEVPKILKNLFGFKTTKNEKFAEDFWINDETGRNLVICETKATVKGFSKRMVYDLYNHRESNDLAENFPAVLFVNLHLNASDWKTKIQSIQTSDSKIAFENNVLILRVEDLMYLWEVFEKKLITKDKVLELFLTEKGWLQFKSDGTYVVVKGNS
jgi:hypothetical protein